MESIESDGSQSSAAQGDPVTRRVTTGTRGEFFRTHEAMALRLLSFLLGPVEAGQMKTVRKFEVKS